jgi:hypothetical protein
MVLNMRLLGYRWIAMATEPLVFRVVAGFHFDPSGGWLTVGRCELGVDRDPQRRQVCSLWCSGLELDS